MLSKGLITTVVNLRKCFSLKKEVFRKKKKINLLFYFKLYYVPYRYILNPNKEWDFSILNVCMFENISENILINNREAEFHIIS